MLNIWIRYRVNIFGFPGNPVTPSNFGLLDMWLAMEWIRVNIKRLVAMPIALLFLGSLQAPVWQTFTRMPMLLTQLRTGLS